MEKSKDVKEVSEVLSAVSKFLRDLAPQIREILNAIFDQFSGEKVGKDIATFYRSLVEAGLDKDMVKDMVMKYYEERVSIVKLIDKLVDKFLQHL